jgi:tRNA dimethylallyltransferase
VDGIKKIPHPEVLAQRASKDAMPEIRPTVVIIAGPTASGKSALALALAEHYGGTIINADTLQCYRDLGILTARPGAAEEARVPHRLYGFLDAAERGSAARWRELALAEIAAASERGMLPILVGGTGLYLRSLMGGLAPVPDIPPAIREEAAALYDRLGGAQFREELARLDPASAARFPPGDRTRLTRAYEVARATGTAIGEWQRRPAEPPPYRFATILLAPPRDILYAACDARFAAMIAAGGLAEAAALLARGLPPHLPVMKAVGLPELFCHLRGEIALGTAVAAGQQATRRFAKRQFTWFRHQLNADLTCVEQYSESFCLSTCHFIDDFLLTHGG